MVTECTSRHRDHFILGCALYVEMAIPCLTVGLSPDIAWVCVLALAVVNQLTWRAVRAVAKTRQCAWILVKMSFLNLAVLVGGILVQKPAVLTGGAGWYVTRWGIVALAGTWLVEINLVRLVTLVLDTWWAKESNRIQEWKTTHQRDGEMGHH